MSNPFFDRPILNSPYECPRRHWELDPSGQPTQQIIERRRRAEFITPIPKPKKRKTPAQQEEIVFDEGKGISTKKQQYDPTSNINEVRQNVDSWRALPSPNQWQVTPETARLLQHWRHHKFGGVRPFFCQVEAVETAIWLTEVAPQSKSGKRLLDHLASANKDANPELMRFALKLATGAGKTTVMAMLIAWQTVNAVRRSNSKHFTRGFLVVTPGLTIKDRLRVLQPNDPDGYYASRELVPQDLLDDVNRAKIVITNFHAFKLRERIELSAGGRSLLTGRTGEELNTTETEGQMIQRAMPDLMGMKNILVMNDEGHHCYREKPDADEDEGLKGDERKEAEKNNEAARLWISGLEAVNRKLGLARVIDLSATPFFLRGSGYAEGTLFPWTMSDFSLMDAIECGIVKLPRVPVAENIPGDEMPVYRNLWENIRKDMPKKGRGQGGELDPLKLPTRLQTALQALYGHYEKTFKLWEEKRIRVPPCFIIVCQNTAVSKLVYDFISGFHRKNEDGTTTLENGRIALFRNFDETTGNPLPRPNTLLIDSEQLEAGDALDDNFRVMASDEIERFRREIIERTGDARAADNLTDQELPSNGSTPVWSAKAAPIPPSSCTRNWRTWPATASPPGSPARWKASAPSKPCSTLTISVSGLRFLAALGGGRPNALFFAGDLGQRIFQQPFSWKSLGVDIRGRSRTLRINYRTSHQIRMQAERLLGPEVTDVDGSEDRSDTVSVFNGPSPVIRVLANEDEEIKSVGTWLAEQSKVGVLPHEFGIFVRSAGQLDRAQAAVKESGLAFKILDEHVETTSGHISISTMHLAKGLEFRAVAVMACDDEIIPLQERIESVGDAADLQEVYDTERHLLYVACTRARDHLLITSVEPASEFLDDLRT